MKKTENDFSPFHLSAPKRKAWYGRWWGILLLLGLGIFGALSVASGLYVFSVAQKWRTGAVTLQQILGTASGTNSQTVYGVNRPTLGNPDAPVVMVAFMDFDCANCQKALLAINQIAHDPYYGQKTLFVFRSFPSLAAGSGSVLAAVAGECAHDQGRFWEVANALYGLRGQINNASIKEATTGTGVDTKVFSECLQSQAAYERVQKDLSDAISLKVQIAPSFLIGDKIIEGAPSVENIKKAVDLLLITQKP